MAEKGRLWTEQETRALLEIWSESSIQRQLQGKVKNNAVYKKLVNELVKRRFIRTGDQCQTIIKALKKKYKETCDKLRRSGAGQESDEEDDETSDFHFFSELDAVMGGRASVDPVHILDSSAGSSSARIGGASEEEEEEEELVDVSTPTSNRSTTPAPNLSRPPTPAPAVSHITTLAPSVSQSVEAPASSVCRSRSPGPVEGESAPKKKRESD